MTPTTAYFHPGSDVRHGLRLDRLYDFEQRTTRHGLLMGSKRRVTLLGPNEEETLGHIARKGSEVIWAIDGHDLHTEKGLLLHAGVMPTCCERGGIRYFLSQQFETGNHLVLIQTGLREDGIPLCHLGAHILGRFISHGSVSPDGGARRIASYHSDLNGRKIPLQNFDLWELNPDGEILVRDILPGRERRLAVLNNTLVAEPAPKKALAFMEESFALTH